MEQKKIVAFEVLTMVAMWAVALLCLPPAPAGVFFGLLFEPEDGDNMFLQNYTPLEPRRPYSSRRRLLLLLLLLLLLCSQFCPVFTYTYLEMYQEFSTTFILVTR
jgi:hypothetical protein